MYSEIGNKAADTATVTITYGGTTSTQFNIFVRQIECDSTSRAPTDCVQYYTGASGTIRSYGWAGAQMLATMDYRICIRDEDKMCSISYKQESGTTIDSFNLLTPAAGAPVAESTTGVCLTAGLALIIPETSPDGITGLGSGTTKEGFPGAFCGGILGFDAGVIAGQLLTSARKPFHIHHFVAPGITMVAPTTGFSVVYQQNAC